MRVNLNINNVNISLESDDKNSLMRTIEKLMGDYNRPEYVPQTPVNPIRNEMKQYVSQVIPTQVSNTRTTFIPASDKQKMLIKRIPEYRDADLNNISKKEAGMIIEKWNKGRGYHYSNHY